MDITIKIFDVSNVVRMSIKLQNCKNASRKHLQTKFKGSKFFFLFFSRFVTAKTKFILQPLFVSVQVVSVNILILRDKKVTINYPWTKFITSNGCIYVSSGWFFRCKNNFVIQADINGILLNYLVGKASFLFLTLDQRWMMF